MSSVQNNSNGSNGNNATSISTVNDENKKKEPASLSNGVKDDDGKKNNNSQQSDKSTGETPATSSSSTTKKEEAQQSNDKKKQSKTDQNDIYSLKLKSKYVLEARSSSLPPLPAEEPKTDDRDNNNNNGKKKKRKRRRGGCGASEQRVEDSEKMCLTIIRGEICPFGSKCKFSHDLKAYMKTRPQDISTIDKCPTFELTGNCVYGAMCRVGSCHILKSTGENVIDKEKNSNAKSDTKNILPKEIQFQLRKKKFPFTCPRFHDSKNKRKHNKKENQKNGKNGKVDETKEQEKKDEKSNGEAKDGNKNGKEDAKIAKAKKAEEDEKKEKDDVKDDKMDVEENKNDENKEGAKVKVEEQKEKDKIKTEEDDVNMEVEEDSNKNEKEAKHKNNKEENNKEEVPEAKDTNGTKKEDKIKMEVENEKEDKTKEDAKNLPSTTTPKQQENNNDSTTPYPTKLKKLIDFSNKVYVAPLTTVGNLPFRRIMKQLGADITCGEMALVSNLLEGKPAEWALLKRHASEDCFGIQLAAGFPDQFTRISEVIAQVPELGENIDFIDLNLGCPLDIICDRGAGAALMHRDKKLQSSLQAITNTLSSQQIPITIKMRTGWDIHKPFAHELIPKIQSWNIPGIGAFMIHGRSRLQRYQKLADWEYIRQIASSSGSSNNIPIIGNGDIFSYTDYEERVGCPLLSSPSDGEDTTSTSSSSSPPPCGLSNTAMLGRGALIKPWLPTEIKERRHWDISATERLDILKDFVKFGLIHWGSDQQGVNTTRRFLLEWLSFLHRYVPVGLLEVVPQQMNQRPPNFICGRSDLETLLSSHHCSDWIKISEMLLGPVPDNFHFEPKHKAKGYA